jgi:group II intron reverse transcriptase/maturase
MGLPTGRKPYGNGAAIVVRGQESCPHGEGRQVSTITKERKVREMRDANTILGIIRERGRRGLPLTDVYRQLFNPALYLEAYGKINRNSGSMAPGATTETVDGMSLEKIRTIIEAVRYERYRWTPARRIYIEKKNSTKKRPLGIPTWSDKLLQEVIRLILEAYFEPQFNNHSHGFRPKRGCHTALREIHRTWTGTTWFIEGDISQCFDKLDHMVLMSILRENIQDNRFLRLIESLLKVGYLEEWVYTTTYSGTPQGGVISPILANIYLDRLDRYVENTLLPEYNRGTRRKQNVEYNRLNVAAWNRKRMGRLEEAKAMRKRLKQLPVLDPNDADYRRLRYVRYADDFLLGFTGPRHEAEEIKQKLRPFLESINLELSEAKTSITNGRNGTARFLGYEICVIHNDVYRGGPKQGRYINGKIGLKVPREVVLAKCQKYMQHNKPVHRTELSNNSEYDIVVQFQQEYRGIVEYYKLAYNRSTQLSRLRWIMEIALTKTLAHKLQISVPRVYRRYETMIQTPDGARKVLEVKVPREGKRPLIARWGGISLKWQKTGILNDQQVRPYAGRNELIQRLLADRCEICGSQEKVEVHHIRHLKDLQKPGRKEKPFWLRLMAARRRKTLIVCQNCHREIHIRTTKAVNEE